MKRLIPATLILFIIVLLCISSNVSVKRNCNKLINDIDAYYLKKISANMLQENWQKSKEKMSAFVNHRFLDDISIYIGQLTVADTDIKSPEFETTRKNILTIISMITEEQRFKMHSFY